MNNQKLNNKELINELQFLEDLTCKISKKIRNYDTSKKFDEAWEIIHNTKKQIINNE